MNKFLNLQYNRLAEAKFSSPERQRLMDDCSAATDDDQCPDIEKRGNHEGFYEIDMYTVYNRL